MSNDVMLSVAQVCALTPGDENNATWINPGFVGTCRKIETKKTKAGKAFYPCLIADLSGDPLIEVSFFNAQPPFREGDDVEFSGKGLRRTEYNGHAQAAIGKDTDVRVIDTRRNQGGAAPRAEPGRLQPNPAPAATSAPPTGDRSDSAVFHRAMKRNATLWLHCWGYAVRTQEKLGLVLSPEQQQGLVATLFIEANRQGLAVIVPPYGTQAAPTPPAQSGGRADPPRQAAPPVSGPGGSAFPANDNFDEDVPF